MCRLGMFDKRFMEVKGKEFMLEFLNQLEKSCGGHGNGILFIDNGNVSLEFKALDFKNDTIVEMLYDNKNGLPDWFLYHTRVASKGSIKDENCHPYINEDKSFALMMNGTVGDFGAFGKYMGDITDTEVIFKVLDKFDVNLEVLTELSPRFIGFKNGKVFATNPSGYGGLVYTDEDGICIASEEPQKESWKRLKKYSVWYEGDELQEEPLVVTQPLYTSYYNSPLSKKEYWWDYVDEDANLTPKEQKDIKDLNTCNSCVVYDDVSYTKQEIKEVIELLIDENANKSMFHLQQAIDEVVGITPIVDNKYCDVIVLDNKQVVLQDEDGNLYEI